MNVLPILLFVSYFLSFNINCLGQVTPPAPSTSVTRNGQPASRTSAPTSNTAGDSSIPTETTTPVKPKILKYEKIDTELQTLDKLTDVGFNGTFTRQNSLMILKNVRDNLDGSADEGKLWQSRLDNIIGDVKDTINKRIFFFHAGIDNSAFNGKPDNLTDDEKKNAKDRYLTAKKGLNRLVETEKRNGELMYTNSIAITKAIDDNNDTELAKLRFRNEALALERQRFDDYRKAFARDTAETSAQLLRLSPRYVDRGPLSMISYGKGPDNDYYSGYRDILFVMFGNSDSLQKVKYELTKNATLIRKEFEQSVQVVSAVVGGAGNVQILSETQTPDQSAKGQKIKVTLYYVPAAQTSPAYTLTATVGQKKFDFEIHEKVYARIKFGFTVSKQDINYFAFKNNQLAFNPDSTTVTRLKSNLIAQLDFSFWPREIDRLRDWRVWENFWTRLSIGVGLKVSKDPLESIFGGLNYALTKNVSATFGVVWHSDDATNIEPINTPTGIVGYVKSNRNRTYTRRAYIGVSISPSAITELLGLKKKE